MSRFGTMPKVELHLHLEGAIPLDALWTLMEERGGDPGVPSPEALAARFAYHDFAHFIETWVWKNRYLDSYRAFEFIAEAVACDLARQHIVYAEAFFSPTDFAQHGLSPQGLATAIRRGLDRVPQIRVALIADLVRDTGPERARRVRQGRPPQACSACRRAHYRAGDHGSRHGEAGAAGGHHRDPLHDRHGPSGHLRHRAHHPGPVHVQ